MFFEWNFLLSYLPIRNVRINGERVSRRSIVSGFISLVCYIIALNY